eukprot:3907255-Rhodomonas_salina.2
MLQQKLHIVLHLRLSPLLRSTDAEQHATECMFVSASNCTTRSAQRTLAACAVEQERGRECVSNRGARTSLGSSLRKRRKTRHAISGT